MTLSLDAGDLQREQQEDSTAKSTVMDISEEAGMYLKLTGQKVIQLIQILVTRRRNLN